MKRLSWFCLLFLNCFFLNSCKKEYSFEGGRNLPPLADAGIDQIISLPKDSIILDGSNSSDPDGKIIYYKWVMLRGPFLSSIIKTDSAKTVAKGLLAGVYAFELKVTDDKGASAKDTVQITVNAGIGINQPPVANAGPDQSITLPKDSVLLNGNFSVDPDGTITSYKWIKISGPPLCNILKPDSSQTTVNALTTGIYQFELTVTDNGGLSAKDTVQITVYATPVIPSCDNRPIINASLVQIGVLSDAGFGLVSASVGNKIFFAGGQREKTGYSSRVDIYNTLTNAWSTAELSSGDRLGMATAAVGNKILFAGGIENDNAVTTTRVDIFDATTNSWSIAELSQARAYLAAATLGNKVFFAGGLYGVFSSSGAVDIYDNATNTWTTGNLSEARYGLSGTAVGTKIYFAGGSKGASLNNISTRIDIFNSVTNSWSTSELQEPKSYMAGIAVNNKIYWGSGVTSAPGNIYPLSNKVEIRDVITGASSSSCMIPKGNLTAIIKDDTIVFFTGSSAFNSGGTHFDIYNITTNTWSTGVLNQKITDATIISVNNIIYVAGGFVNGALSDKVWKLDF